MINKRAARILDDILDEMVPAAKIVEKLQDLGYDNHFQFVNGSVYCLQTRVFYDPDDVSVDQVYRFEDESGALGTYFLYALQERGDGLKGLLNSDKLVL